MGNALIFNADSEEREFLFKLVSKLGPVYASPSLDKAIPLLKSLSFSFVLLDLEQAGHPALRPLLGPIPCLILTGRHEDKLKEAVLKWPADRFVDYILLSSKPADITRGQRALWTAREYARLKEDVESLTCFKASAETRLKKVSSEIKEIGRALSGSLVKELQKRITLQSQYLRFQKLKHKFEDTLRKLYAANDVGNLLDIVHDIKDLIQAGSLSLYICEENETLGKFLKPLVWDDAVPSHADFARHVALLPALDFASVAARTGQEINVPDAARDSRYSDRYRNHLKSPLRNILVAPLKYDQDVIGLIEVYNREEDGRVRTVGFTAEDQQVLRGVSEHITLAITKLNLIQYDALTGLLRPDPFFEKVLQKIESQSKRRQETGSFAMVMGDVDWFKNFNDRNGHEAGNRLLRELAGVMKSAIREEDLLCRYGGEEFLLFLSGVNDIEEATHLTERIRKAIEDHYFEFEEFQPRQNLTMSFGVTLFPRALMDERGAATKATLKKFANEADMALAEAKGKRFAALKYAEGMVVKNKVCAYVRDKSAVAGKISLLKTDAETTSKEKRRHARYFTATLCIYRENDGYRVATMVDLSLGGAKISSKAQFPPAKTLDLFLILGSRANPLKGDVVYSQKVSPNSAYFHTGLKFHLLSDEDEHLLRSYFLSLEKTDGSSA